MAMQPKLLLPALPEASVAVLQIVVVVDVGVVPRLPRTGT
jgi:hypothetical protein